MTYVVTQNGKGIRQDDYFIVNEDTEKTPGGPFAEFTEAEAHIIAFALNAIADGHTLARHQFDQGGQVYDGPTEGVARG